MEHDEHERLHELGIAHEHDHDHAHGHKHPHVHENQKLVSICRRSSAWWTRARTVRRY